MKYWILIIVFTLCACSQDQNDPEVDPLGHFYFPLNLNNFWIYQVEEQIYNSDGTVTLQEYQLLYEIVEKETDFELAEFTIQVQKRLDEHAPWEDTLLFTAYRTNYTAVLNTGSASFVKLSFPTTYNKQWNGNALNGKPEDTYKIDSVNMPFTVKDEVFENTLTVTQEYSLDPIQITSDYIKQEVYAYNTGLIYWEEKNISYKSCGSIYPECCGANNINICFGEINEGYVKKKFLMVYEINL